MKSIHIVEAFEIPVYKIIGPLKGKFTFPDGSYQVVAVGKIGLYLLVEIVAYPVTFRR